MERRIACPICHNQAEYRVYNEEFGTVEEYIICDVCGYQFDFAYGGYRELVGRKEFVWNYTLVGDEWKCLMKKISKAKFMARRNWKKFKKRKLRKRSK